MSSRWTVAVGVRCLVSGLLLAGYGALAGGWGPRSLAGPARIPALALILASPVLGAAVWRTAAARRPGRGTLRRALGRGPLLWGVLTCWAFGEEALLRGPVLLTSGRQRLAVIGVGLALFPALHPPYGWASSRPYVLLGAICTVATLLASGLVPAGMIHAVYNALSLEPTGGTSGSGGGVRRDAGWARPVGEALHQAAYDPAADDPTADGIRRPPAPRRGGPGEPLVSVDGVSRRFGSRLALDEVSFDLFPGEIVALLGPNGAGKTTLASVLTGLRRPDGGRVAVLGAAPASRQARSHVGVMPQDVSFPPVLRVQEIAEFVGRHRPPGTSAVAALRAVGLDGLRHRQAGGLSVGERRRLAFALALLGAPRLLLVDEPTANLDREGRLLLWAQLQAFRADGGCVLLTTHDVGEAERVADRVLVMAAGRVVRDSSPAVIRRSIDRSHVSFVVAEDVALPESWPVSREGTAVRMTSGNPEDVVRWLVSSGVDFRELAVIPASLEEAVALLVDESETCPAG